jgi:hypothetical protein
MPDTESKSWLGIAGEFVRRLPILPTLLFVAGFVFLALAATIRLGVGDYQVAAASDFWRYVSACVGLLLILASIASYWLEARSDKPKRPGPYTHTGNFPLRIEGPNAPIAVSHDDYKFKVKGIRKGLEWPDYKIMLMHADDRKVSPRFSPVIFRPLAHGEYSWETEVKLPEIDNITKQETWRLAFYYVGPSAKRLIDHHEAVCRYFAPDGKPKRWPPIENPPDEIVQCSEVLRVSFGPARETTPKRPI